MPAVYYGSELVTMYDCDPESKTFDELEVILATEALRTRANLRVEIRSLDHDSRPWDEPATGTWRDFAARADFDGLIFRRCLQRWAAKELLALVRRQVAFDTKARDRVESLSSSLILPNSRQHQVEGESL